MTIDDVRDYQNSRDGKWPEPTRKQPGMKTLERWCLNEGTAKATDGCTVEPDGTCPHGHPSWLLRLGLI